MNLDPAPGALTKSRYLAGLQCELRLWQQLFGAEHALAVDAADALRRDEGAEIGRRAQRLFPGGRTIDAGEWKQACSDTRELLNDPSIPALFEAAFESGVARVRVDVLERLSSGGYALVEVKSATRVRGEHIDDVAFQLMVLEDAGIDVRSACVLHLDSDYVCGADGVDLGRLFRRADVFERARPRIETVRGDVERLLPSLEREDAPPIEPSEQCRRPRWCEFWRHCTREKPRDWIGNFPGLTSAWLVALQQDGIETIGELPDTYPRTPVQERAFEALVHGREVTSPALARALEPLGPPCLYLDFETWAPAVPRFAGARPYQQVPYQWSLHRLDADGQIEHSEFLAEVDGDPRRAFARTLLDATSAGSEPILVYSGFESDRLGELARDLPDLAPGLEALRSRLCDLHALVRDHVYYPAFAGSLSLKRVAPALSPGFGYGDLDEVANGGEAVVALERLAKDPASEAVRTRLRSALLAYCERDTLALVEVHRALRSRARLE